MGRGGGGEWGSGGGQRSHGDSANIPLGLQQSDGPDTMLVLIFFTTALLLNCSAYLPPSSLQVEDYNDPPDTRHNLREFVLLRPELDYAADQRNKRFFWDWLKKEKTNR